MPGKLPDGSHADFWHRILCDFMLDVKLALRQEIKILDSISHPNRAHGVCVYGPKMLYLDTQIKTFKKGQLVSRSTLRAEDDSLTSSHTKTMFSVWVTSVHPHFNHPKCICIILYFISIFCHPAYSAWGHGFKL